jgi:trimeric autotransporter adhesin
MKKKSTLLLDKVLPWLLRSAAILLILCASLISNAQIHLIKDINQSGDPYYTEFGTLINVDERLFFFATGGLYTTDGTTAGTSLIHPLNSMPAAISYNGQLVFAGDDGDGLALWKSDGTHAGTVKVKNIAPFTTFMNTRGSFTIVNNTLFFTADDGVSGVELWKTDGSTAGTVRVKDIKPGAASSNPFELTAVNNKLFFSAPSGNNKGIELWTSDGTSAGTVVVYDIYPGSNSSDPSRLTNVNGTCFFVAKNGTHGRELWKSDGTAAGTVLVKDIRPGSPDGQVAELTNVDGVLFFEAHDGVHGKELWKSDGTPGGTVLVKDITPGPGSSGAFATDHLSSFYSFNGLLYFVCFHNGHRLWRSDGTDAGTIPLSSNAVEFGFLNPDINVFNDQVYFLAQSNWDFTELWKTDGTPGGTVQVVSHLANFDYGTYAQLEPSGNILYMVAQEYNPESGEMSGTKLMKSDGTAEGTSVVFDVFESTLGSEPRMFTKVGSNLFLSAYQADNYYSDLWLTDGTEEGTRKIGDFEYIHDFIALNGNLIFGGYESYFSGESVWISDGTSEGTERLMGVALEYPAVLGNEVIFSGDNNTGSGRELWKTDGTVEGTALIKDINTAGSSGASYMTTVGGLVLFAARDHTGDGELWKSDGTAAGTTMLKNINPTGPGNPLYFVSTGNRLFFTADDGVSGRELWISDGTAAGTVMVRDMSTGDSKIDNITALNENVVFTAVNQYGSKGLWYSDGTTVGTYLLRDFYPGEEIIDVLGVNGSEVVMLVTDDAVDLTEIWKTDGTPTGTVKVIDLNRYSPYSDGGAALDGVFYFSLVYNSNQLWRTDGTACGSYGIEYAYPIAVGGVAAIGSKIVFNGSANEAQYVSNYGPELYGYNPETTSPCISAVARSAQEEQTIQDERTGTLLSVYPNPFKNQIAINIPGNENEKYQIQIVSISGKTIEQRQELYHNRDYYFGAGWSNGIYIMKATVNGRLVTSKLIKTN